MSLETREQETQFNFIDQAGAGLVFSLKASLDLELGYRFWHISNAGIRHPNSGINGHAVHVGTTVRF